MKTEQWCCPIKKHERLTFTTLITAADLLLAVKHYVSIKKLIIQSVSSSVASIMPTQCLRPYKELYTGMNMIERQSERFVTIRLYSIYFWNSDSSGM